MKELLLDKMEVLGKEIVGLHGAAIVQLQQEYEEAVPLALDSMKKLTDAASDQKTKVQASLDYRHVWGALLHHSTQSSIVQARGAQWQRLPHVIRAYCSFADSTSTLERDLGQLARLLRAHSSEVDGNTMNDLLFLLLQGPKAESSIAVKEHGTWIPTVLGNALARGWLDRHGRRFRATSVGKKRTKKQAKDIITNADGTRMYASEKAAHRAWGRSIQSASSLPPQSDISIQPNQALRGLPASEQSKSLRRFRADTKRKATSAQLARKRKNPYPVGPLRRAQQSLQDGQDSELGPAPKKRPKKTEGIRANIAVAPETRVLWLAPTPEPRLLANHTKASTKSSHIVHAHVVVDDDIHNALVTPPPWPQELLGRLHDKTSVLLVVKALGTPACSRAQWIASPDPTSCTRNQGHKP